MRRFTLWSAATIALTVAIPMAVSAGPASPRDARPVDEISVRAVDRVTDLEAIRLECRVRATDADAVVHCEWSQPTSPRAAGIRLYRLNPAFDEHRQVVYRSTDLSVTQFTDTKIRPGNKYAYGIVVVNEDGHMVGRSRVEWVRVPGRSDPEIEVLRLHCALGAEGEAIGCEWSRPHSERADVVALWRSVDGGRRELVERFRPEGPNTYRDRVPPGAHRIRYAVIASTEDGVVVGRSRAETVVIPHDRPTDVRSIDRESVATQPPVAAPAPTPTTTTTAPTTTAPPSTTTTTLAPVDTRPVDTQPIDSRPVDSRPVDTRPVDTQPVDTRPVDTQPVDTRPVDTQPVDTRPARTEPRTP